MAEAGQEGHEEHRPPVTGKVRDVGQHGPTRHKNNGCCSNIIYIHIYYNIIYIYIQYSTHYYCGCLTHAEGECCRMKPRLEVPLLASATEAIVVSPQGINQSRLCVPLFIATKLLHSIPITTRAPSGHPARIIAIANLGCKPTCMHYIITSIRGLLQELIKGSSANPAFPQRLRDDFCLVADSS